ncbi:UTP--glucose-1-phosphate uridylyltransferase GalU [Carnobacterium divergens]|uniref:UTP--glucose-1-phosphate uridylyltransferase GalU n=1 Tax=Carnobacterium divergens TaxID=2748 RepID=UPI0028925F81|nr:UTP--glucose-1-phosphate uridylyltransferase GalU [Carnobacterium divergens]MDT1939317.1 UTP--glucose-1-phosphate uridylyltransferase GalU [Carnobacterium divergens]MDT1941755.1 UTP--glucose-1-phosphate uridylyltransferase GalU [Carnobacterium divergens]MDT1947553.1 UTP--glucose-1-phosphate uridylyltransferase GalU [Carnobacterium divergens]MDT1949992.1 UTP--glucose-1-phosphate uridylyltransferase GalU [Carnobacterium divergens]MDT1955170.1 UTP--glucose-1-phosphate uridylyltransferase GalU 
MKNVRKAIIPVGGLGTRFLPITKSVAKEMLPIIDKPTIQFIIEEAKEAGIEEILLVTGRGKRSIEDYFDSHPELESTLKEKGKTDLLKLVEETTGIKLHFIRQTNPHGLGHAILQGKSFIGDEPFVVLLGDDLMADTQPLTKQLIEAYEKKGRSIVATMAMPLEEISKYGVVSPMNHSSNKQLCQVDGLIEKPAIEDAPSNLAIVGRYLLTPAIFDLLETQEPGVGNEIQLTDAIAALNKQEEVYSYEFKGTRYDVGDKMGFLKTNIEYGLNHPELKEDLKTYLKTITL